MYPSWSEEEVWEICIELLENDSPIPSLKNVLMEFRFEFANIYDFIREEHSHMNGKYYRTKDNEPIVNPLNLAHYSRLIYYFSRTLFLKDIDRLILDQLFLSIRSRCNIDLFYEIELKQYFRPEHPLGSVLGRAEYSDYFVICQNCTVGNNRNLYPVFGKRVVLRPGAIILGNCKIGNNVHIGASSLIIDTDIPDNSMVFGQGPNLVIKDMDKIATDEFFDE